MGVRRPVRRGLLTGVRTKLLDSLNLLKNLALLLVASLVAGVVVAAALFPVMAFSGLAAKAGGEAFGQLPDELTVRRSPQNSYIYASDDQTLLTVMYDENRRDLPLSEIPELVQHALLAAEDQKFYDHNGVDTQGIARAFIANQASGATEQGASTITMQLVRMSLTYSLDNTPEGVLKATEDTNYRKLREVRYALALERKMDKKQILENYLNTAFFGSRAYGIYAASQVYFGKHPKDLTAAEAAFLAGLVKFPGNMDKESGRQAAVQRRDYVLNEMQELGYLKPDDAATAKAEKTEIKIRPVPNGCVQATTNNWGFFCDYFQRWWLHQEVFGPTDYDRERQLRSGGYRIRTSMDVAIQQASFNAAVAQAPIGAPEALLLASIEPGTGKVRSLATNRYYQLDEKHVNGPMTNPRFAPGTRGSYPNTTNPYFSTDRDFQGYRPGSVMKIFTMVSALENGYPLDYVINTQPRALSKYRIYGDPKDLPVCGQPPYWCPPNSNNSDFGPQNMWQAFGSSVNTYFVPLFDFVGGDKVMDTARRLGLTFYDVPDNPNDKSGVGTKDDDYASSTNLNIAKIWSPFTLGISTHPPLQIANAFATLAADGLYCEPTPVESIHNIHNQKLNVGGPKCTQNIDAEVARAAIDASRCPVGDSAQTGSCSGATAGESRRIIGKPIAGKTGTSDNESTATLTITTKQLAMSGFLVDPDYPDTPTKMKHKGNRGVNPAVQNAMAAAMKNKPGIQFTKPTNSKLIRGAQSAIPDVTCKSVPEAMALLKGAGFKPEVDTKRPVPSACPPGTAAGTTPTGKTLKGGVVVINVSSGGGAPPTGPPGRGGG
ncbi:MAG TPA: transglycosylase domain-containing protein [Candidatus Limnocylindrales bacterium]|nr:transglycosylase domain-containing protein [Candidatus Limnocylindrales bacterium]